MAFRRTVLMLTGFWLVARGATPSHADEYFQLTVERAVVEPLKPDGRYWDTLPGAPTSATTDEIDQSAKIREVVSLALKAGSAALKNSPAGFVVDLGGKVLLFGVGRLADAIKYPDVVGQLYVNGQLTLNLPVVRDSSSPFWVEYSAPLRLKLNDRIRLVLADKDIGAKIDDQIGVCDVLVTDAILQEGSALMQNCAGGALAAAIGILRQDPQPSPQPVASGIYEIQSVQLGVSSLKPSNNKTWDPAGTNPDLLMTISVGGTTYTCDLVRDDFKIACITKNLFLDTSLTTSVVVKVVDVDEFVDDFIGTATVDVQGRSTYDPIPMNVTSGVQFASLQLGAPSAVPEALTRQQLATALKAVRPLILACGEIHGKGTVQTEISIGPSGLVKATKRKEGPEALGDCVANSFLSARFPQSKRGASVTYPSVFR